MSMKPFWVNVKIVKLICFHDYLLLTDYFYLDLLHYTLLGYCFITCLITAWGILYELTILYPQKRDKSQLAWKSYTICKDKMCASYLINRPQKIKICSQFSHTTYDSWVFTSAIWDIAHALHVCEDMLLLFCTLSSQISKIEMTWDFLALLMMIVMMTTV